RDVTLRRATGAAGPLREVVHRPLPDVAGHVEQAEAVRREPLDRRRAFEPVGAEVLPGELALPGVRHHASLRGELIAPRVGGALEAAAGGVLPFGFGRQR